MRTHRSKSADIVNAETTIAHVMGGLLSMGVTEAQKHGAKIEFGRRLVGAHDAALRVAAPPG